MSILSSMARVSLIALACAAASGVHAQSQTTQTPAAGQAPVSQAQTSAPTESAATSNTAAIETAFKRADGNSDGKLSNEEAQQYPGLAARFTEFDKNRDGTLST